MASNTARRSQSQSPVPAPRGGFRSAMTLRSYLCDASVYDVHIGRLKSVMRRPNALVYSATILYRGDLHYVLTPAPATGELQDNEVAVVVQKHGSQELRTVTLPADTLLALVPARY